AFIRPQPESCVFVCHGQFFCGAIAFGCESAVLRSHFFSASDNSRGYDLRGSATKNRKVSYDVFCWSTRAALLINQVESLCTKPSCMRSWKIRLPGFHSTGPNRAMRKTQRCFTSSTTLLIEP